MLQKTLLITPLINPTPVALLLCICSLLLLVEQLQVAALNVAIAVAREEPLPPKCFEPDQRMKVFSNTKTSNVDL